MPVIADLPKILRGYNTIDDDQLSEGLRAATMHFVTSIHMGRGMFQELDQFNMVLTSVLEPEFHKGICGTEFQILAEDTLEKMYYEMPEERRIGTKYRRSEREFIANGGAYLRKSKEYLRTRDEKRLEEAKAAKREEAKAAKKAAEKAAKKAAAKAAKKVALGPKKAGVSKK